MAELAAALAELRSGTVPTVMEMEMDEKAAEATEEWPARMGARMLVAETST